MILKQIDRCEDRICLKYTVLKDFWTYLEFEVQKYPLRCSHKKIDIIRHTFVAFIKDDFITLSVFCRKNFVEKKLFSKIFYHQLLF